jgi:hypothetical protein
MRRSSITTFRSASNSAASKRVFRIRSASIASARFQLCFGRLNSYAVKSFDVIALFEPPLR